MALKRLWVNLGERSYEILVGENSTDHLLPELERLLPKTKHAILVHDAAVCSLAENVAQRLNQHAWRVDLIPVASGESSKSVAQLDQIWQAMLDCRADRGSVVIAIGGGVVGDLAGFAAASYARGLALVQMPTTLLSQVDSSVGGKTGINLPGAKNMVGAFWQPRLVVIDSHCLETLPEREFVSGLAEIVKYGVILLPELFSYLEQHSAAILSRNADSIQHIIIESCRAKALVVQEDERETSGRRAILNYGHTFAHAIEATQGYGTWLHGEAVAIGMNMAAHLAQRLGRIDQQLVDRQKQLLVQLKLPCRIPQSNADALWQAMQADKKMEHGQLRFILPASLGSVELISGVHQADVLAAIHACTEP